MVTVNGKHVNVSMRVVPIPLVLLEMCSPIFFLNLCFVSTSVNSFLFFENKPNPPGCGKDTRMHTPCEDVC